MLGSLIALVLVTSNLVSALPARDVVNMILTINSTTFPTPVATTGALYVDRVAGAARFFYPATRLAQSLSAMWHTDVVRWKTDQSYGDATDYFWQEVGRKNVHCDKTAVDKVYTMETYTNNVTRLQQEVQRIVTEVGLPKASVGFDSDITTVSALPQILKILNDFHVNDIGLWRDNYPVTEQWFTLMSDFLKSKK